MTDGDMEYMLTVSFSLFFFFLFLYWGLAGLGSLNRKKKAQREGLQ